MRIGLTTLCPRSDVEFSSTMSRKLLFLLVHPVGWAQLWLAITYWSSSCLSHLKVPLYVSTQASHTRALCACMIYTAGAFIVFPFPLGTFSLGLPTFGCFFACLVCDALPAGSLGKCESGRATEEDKEGCEVEDKEEEERKKRVDILRDYAANLHVLDRLDLHAFFLVKLKNLDNDSPYWKIPVKVGFVIGRSRAARTAKFARNRQRVLWRFRILRSVVGVQRGGIQELRYVRAWSSGRRQEPSYCAGDTISDYKDKSSRSYQREHG